MNRNSHSRLRFALVAAAGCLCFLVGVAFVVSHFFYSLACMTGAATCFALCLKWLEDKRE